MQHALAIAEPRSWFVLDGEPLVAGCFVAFARGHRGRGRRGEPAWAAASVMQVRRRVADNVTTGRTGGPYEPGLLALRIGALLESVVRDLSKRPDVLLVDATGRDHPRRAGLALHLGAVLQLPTVGVTHRPLVAAGEPPANRYGATSPLRLDSELVGFLVRTREGVRPVAVHAAWQVDAGTAVDVVLRCTRRRRTPEPLREARRLARTARNRDPSGGRN